MPSNPKADLYRYLQMAREVMLWKLEGLSDYDVRRPLVATGTNLLGLVKHLAWVEVGYFGYAFGRPFEDTGGRQPLDERLRALRREPNGDMWATADESRLDIVRLYQRAWAHSDATIESLALDAVGQVPWWPPDTRQATLHRVLVHVIAETHRHAGHADIVRELIDGAAGWRKGTENLPLSDQGWWEQYRQRLERVAKEAGQG